MIVAFKPNLFKGSLTADRLNAGKLAKFSQYTVGQTTATHETTKFIILISLDTALIADFNCDEYFDFDALEVNNVWAQAHQWSHCVSFFDNFLGESQPGFLFFEDLPEGSAGFRNWLTSLTTNSVENKDGYCIKGRNSILESQSCIDFSSFCDHFERLHVDTRPNAKPFSYKDAILKSSPAPSPMASDPSQSSTFTTITSKPLQPRKWTPQFVVVKAPFNKMDKQYGTNSEKMLDDDGEWYLTSLKNILNCNTSVLHFQSILT